MLLTIHIAEPQWETGQSSAEVHGAVAQHNVDVRGPECLALMQEVEVLQQATAVADGQSHSIPAAVGRAWASGAGRGLLKCRQLSY